MAFCKCVVVYSVMKLNLKEYPFLRSIKAFRNLYELIENQADILIPTLIHESNAETDVDLHIGWSKLIVVAGELHNACELALQMISFVHFFFLDGNVLVKGFWQNSPSFQGSICQDGEITRVREALRLVFLL